MFLARGHSHVTHRKSHEYDRLDHTDNRAERIKRERHEELGEPGENAEHGVIGKHVGVETNAERKRAEEVVGELDREHQDRERQIRAEETPEIPHALRGEPLVDVIAETNYPERERQIRITGRWLHPGDQAEEVA